MRLQGKWSEFISYNRNGGGVFNELARQKKIFFPWSSVPKGTSKCKQNEL